MERILGYSDKLPEGVYVIADGFGVAVRVTEMGEVFLYKDIAGIESYIELLKIISYTQEKRDKLQEILSKVVTHLKEKG